MNAFQGILLSFLFLIFGISIPESDNTDKDTFVVAKKQKTIKIVETTEKALIDSEKQTIQLPAVKNDHPGKRAKVSEDLTERCPKWEQAFADYGLFPIETWSYIAWRESRCRVKAQNATWDSQGNMTYYLNNDKSYDTGLLQINSSWRSKVALVCGEWAIENHMQGLKTLDCNLRFARWIMENSKGGLSNWRM